MLHSVQYVFNVLMHISCCFLITEEPHSNFQKQATLSHTEDLLTEVIYLLL